jgi:hypothetical protein
MNGNYDEEINRLFHFRTWLASENGGTARIQNGDSYLEGCIMLYATKLQHESCLYCHALCEKFIKRKQEYNGRIYYTLEN